MLHPEERLAWIELDFRKYLGDPPPGHELDKLVVVARFCVDGRNPPSVAQYGDAVADAADFAHPMRDVDDADALLLCLLDEREQPVGFTFGKRCSRLIEDQDRWRRAKGLGDFDHLLFRPRQVSDPLMRI